MWSLPSALNVKVKKFLKKRFAGKQPNNYGSQMPRHIISNARESNNKITTVAIYCLVKP